MANKTGGKKLKCKYSLHTWCANKGVPSCPSCHKPIKAKFKTLKNSSYE